MEQATAVPLGVINAYGTQSGYIYLHIPSYLCRQFGITPLSAFAASYRDGKLVLEQVKEKKNAQLGDSSAEG